MNNIFIQLYICKSKNQDEYTSSYSKDFGKLCLSKDQSDSNIDPSEPSRNP